MSSHPTEEAWRITDMRNRSLAYGFGLRLLSVALKTQHDRGRRLSELRILFGRDAESQS